MSDTQEPISVPGASRNCALCQSALCLRQQVLNMSLAKLEGMLCLPCLAKDSSSSPAELLCHLKEYILSRDCFKKQWVRYEGVSACPDPEGCLPHVCFDS